ncbi:MAG TPA: hypothetical protein DHD79_07930 [Firmicutes bacterium]|uniref:WD40 repeat domain-containing protein n=1 Tax=Syntrophomonas wolfei TaxID=863 RepID=A0A354YU89_9FIRM|nr:hypothetical protein [Syntrophomonas wolfei]HCF88466.1 hypothetical protein [Bacillota bacterium]HCF92716.1 hypothetical protein [Bacillota bacterium]HCX71158.1 hypothetical protein [Bacillota bacterium]
MHKLRYRLLLVFVVSLWLVVVPTRAQNPRLQVISYAGTDVYAIALAPSGERFAITDGSEGLLYYEDKKPFCICKDPEAVFAFDPQGQTILFISNQVLGLWSIQEKALISTITINQWLDYTFGLTWINEDIFILGFKAEAGNIVILDAKDFTVRKIIPADGIQFISSAAKLPSKLFLLNDSYYPFGSIESLDLVSLKTTPFNLPFNKFLIMNYFAVSPDGKLAVAQNAEPDNLPLQIFELSSHRVIYDLEGPISQVCSISWNSTGDLIGVTFDGKAYLIRYETR